MYKRRILKENVYSKLHVQYSQYDASLNVYSRWRSKRMTKDVTRAMDKPVCHNTSWSRY